MRWLRSKYHRPQEMRSSILKCRTDLRKPVNDRSLMKANILVMLTIKRDLIKLNYLSKIDAFYINIVVPRIFTQSVYENYLREHQKWTLEYDQKKSDRRGKLCSPSPHLMNQRPQATKKRVHYKK